MINGKKPYINEKQKNVQQLAKYHQMALSTAFLNICQCVCWIYETILREFKQNKKQSRIFTLFIFVQMDDKTKQAV